jgi:hypothetical protein
VLVNLLAPCRGYKEIFIPAPKEVKERRFSRNRVNE